MERRNFLGGLMAGTAATGMATGLPIEAQVRPVASERNSVRAADFGAIGNGSADDTPAIQRAIDEVHKMGGGTVHLEGSSGRKFRCAGKLNFDNKRGVRLSGSGGPNADEEGQILFTGGTGPFISLRSCFAVTLDHLRLTARGKIAGPFVATGHSAAKSDTMHLIIERCMFDADADNLLDLSLCISSAVRNCLFIGGTAAIHGASGGYSNAIQISECMFVRQREVAIRNAGESWFISGCTFEPLATGKAGALRQEGARPAWGLTFIGCWMGDSDKGGTWIDLSGGPAYGLSVVGNRFSGNGTAIKIGKGTQGVSISGNRIEGETGIDFVEPYTYGAAIVGNDLQAKVPIKGLANVLQHFVGGQYTTENSFSGTTHFEVATFSGARADRGSLQIVPGPPIGKPQEGDIWLTGGGLYIRVGGQNKRFVLS